MLSKNLGKITKKKYAKIISNVLYLIKKQYHRKQTKIDYYNYCIGKIKMVPTPISIQYPFGLVKIQQLTESQKYTG